MLRDRYSPGVATSSSSNKTPVSGVEGAEMARSIKAHRYAECSAKTRDGIDDVFHSAAKAALSPSRQKRNRSGGGHRICVAL